MAEDQTEAAEPATPKRKTIAKKVYIDKDGTESKFPAPSTVSCELRFGDGAGVIVVNMNDIGKGCRIAGQWHGVADKLANAYNRAENCAEAFASATAMLERLVENEWVKPGTGAGPSTNFLVLAIIRLIEGKGEEVDDARKAGIREKVTGKDNRASVMANPAIAASYKVVQAEEAQRRAEAATAALKDSGAATDLTGF